MWWLTLKEVNHPFKDKKELFTDPIFLIGNGKSRTDFNLERLRGKGTIIGCNALYRDFAPDILIAIDAKMVRELKESNYSENNICLLPNNRNVPLKNAYRWTSNRYNTSGCFAMQFISQVFKPKKCYMFGMDAYPGNVYDGTKNYNVHTLMDFTGITNFYLKALSYPSDTVFINVNVKNMWPESAYESGRYKFITYEEFENDYRSFN